MRIFKLAAFLVATAIATLASGLVTAASAGTMSFTDANWTWSDGINQGEGNLTTKLLCSAEECGSGTDDYRITSMSGLFDNLYSVTLGRQDSYDGNDNLLFYPASPNALDDLGVSFFLSGDGPLNGDEVNISYDAYSLSDSFGDLGSPSGTFTVTPASTSVPEPLTLGLFGAGLAGAVLMRRRNKGQKA